MQKSYERLSFRFLYEVILARLGVLTRSCFSRPVVRVVALGPFFLTSWQVLTDQLLYPKKFSYLSADLGMTRELSRIRWISSCQGFLKRFYVVTFLLVSGWNLASGFNITSWWPTDL